jgi:hypothetical protein
MNKAAANVQKSPAEMELLIKKLKIEVATLKGQLLEMGVAPRAADPKAQMPLAIDSPTGSAKTQLTPSTGHGSSSLALTANKDDIKSAMAISPKAGQDDLFKDLESEQKAAAGEMVPKDTPEETK